MMWCNDSIIFLEISAVVDNPADSSWEELEYYWAKWRDASGKQIKGQFADYVSKLNDAAEANGNTNNIMHDTSQGLGTLGDSLWVENGNRIVQLS